MLIYFIQKGRNEKSDGNPNKANGELSELRNHYLREFNFLWV